MNEDVQAVVEGLIELGVINESGCKQFADILRSLKVLGNKMGGSASGNGGKATARAPAKDLVEIKPRGRRKRNSLEVDKATLADLYKTETAKAIAEKYGISTSTVNLRLKAYGLTGVPPRDVPVASRRAVLVT